MKWRNLQENKCPQCGRDWAFDLEITDRVKDGVIIGPMLTHKCGFMISEQRYNEIVSDRTGQYIAAHDPGEMLE